MTGCTSCGRSDEDTRPVRRVHLVLPHGDATDPTSIDEWTETTVLDEDEQWCATCREQFPHVSRP